MCIVLTSLPWLLWYHFETIYCRNSTDLFGQLKIHNKIIAMWDAFTLTACTQIYINPRLLCMIYFILKKLSEAEDQNILQCRVHKALKCLVRYSQSSGAVRKSRWLSWAPVPNKPMVSVDVKQQCNNIKLDKESRWDQEEGEELNSHKEVRLSSVGPGEIKRREVVLDPQESPEEIKSREVELGSES